MQEKIGLIIFIVILLIMSIATYFFSKKILEITNEYSDEYSFNSNATVELVTNISNYAAIVFQLFIIDRITLLRKEKQTITEDIMDEIIADNMFKAYNMIPVGLKNKFIKSFAALDDPQAFLLEILAQDLRIKVGGIK